MTSLHEITENQPAARLQAADVQEARNLKPKGRFDAILASLSEPAYALLRAIAGLLFAFHGMQGLTGYQIPAEFVPKFGSQGWIGSVIELAAGLLVAGGLFTRWAAFLASGTMAVAYVQFHWKFQFGAQFFPALNQGEMALVYCLVFFVFATRGPGRPAADGILGKR
jgi:putative oxidoreductase